MTGKPFAILLCRCEIECWVSGHVFYTTTFSAYQQAHKSSL